ncbi:hypothetical protein FJ251_15935, partial [bacterium]|nr:hypothetical protein [bacterium]
LRSDEAEVVRASAARALGRAGGREAEEALGAALGDRYRSVRQAALDALNAMGWRPGSVVAEAIVALAGEDWQALGRLGEPAVPLLERVLRERGLDSGSVGRRAGAVQALVGVGGAALTALLPALADTHPTVRALATRGYGTHAAQAPAGAAAELRRLLRDDPSGHVRVGAATALGRIGDEQAVALLHSAAKGDPEDKVRFAAAEALACPALRQTGFLVQRLSDKSPEIRVTAANALGASGDPAAIDPLVEAMGDAVLSVREAAGAALASLGWMPLGVRTHVADHAYARWMSRRELQARTGLEDQKAMLVAELSSSSPAARRCALEAIARWRDPTLAGPVQALLDDVSRLVRTEAALALEILGAEPGEDVQGALVQVARGRMDEAARFGDVAGPALSRALLEHTGVERVRAAEALARLSPEAGAEALSSAVRGDRDAAVRVAAAKSLGALRAGHDALGAALADSESDVRAEACRGLAASNEGVRLLRGALAHDAAVARAAALAGLSAAGDVASAGSAAAMLLGDADAIARIAAAEAMPALAGAGALQPLAACIANDEVSEVRAAAARALGRVPGEGSQALLVDTLCDGAREVRQACVAALDEQGWKPDDDLARALLDLAREDWKALGRQPAAVPYLDRVLREPGHDPKSIP